MKKTIPTTLAGTLFYIEEDAYEKLSAYLDSIKKHFAGDADSAEIISDIENRMAEQFLEHSNKDKVVTLAEVETLIASMGHAEDFGDENMNGGKAGTEEAAGGIKSRKLFRNPDDKMIAGVASGLAAFFGIDAAIVRIIFVIVTLFGGSGVLIYIILWLIVPEAKTSAEKLEMRGEKINLESLKEMAKEKINEVKDNPRARSSFREAVRLPFVILRKILHAIVPIIRKIVGICITLGASITLLGSLFILTVTVFNIHSPYVDFPVFALGHTALIYAVLFAVFFIIFIPIMFIFLAGVRLTSNTRVFHPAAALSLAGLWCLCIIFAGAAGTRLVPEYRDYIATSPDYQVATQDFPLADFTGMRVENGNKVTLVHDATFKVSATGTEKSISNLSMTVVDGELVINSTKHWWLCIFCNESRPDISVTMPEIQTLSLANGSRLTANGIAADDLTLTLANGSRADMSFDAKNFTLDEANASWVKLSGTADAADFKLANGSDADAKKLIVDVMKIIAENGSVADIHADKTLDADLANGSIVTYTGDAKITKDIKNGSRLQQKMESLEYIQPAI